MRETKASAQTVWVDETEEVCLNCQYFRQYFMDGKGTGKFAHVPLNKGWCQYHRAEQPAIRPPCTYKRMKETSNPYRKQNAPAGGSNTR